MNNRSFSSASSFVGAVMQGRLHIFARWLALFAAIISTPAMAHCSSCEGIARNFAKKESFNGVVLVAQGPEWTTLKALAS